MLKINSHEILYNIVSTFSFNFIVLLLIMHQVRGIKGLRRATVKWAACWMSMYQVFQLTSHANLLDCYTLHVLLTGREITSMQLTFSFCFRIYLYPVKISHCQLTLTSYFAFMFYSVPLNNCINLFSLRNKLHTLRKFYHLCFWGDP